MKQRFLIAIALIVVLVPVAAAAGREKAAFGREAWRAEIAARGLDPQEVVYPFDATDEMIGWAREATVNRVSNRSRDVLARLQGAIFEDGAFDFSYDDTHTFTAAGAFDARRGNCMSFTALFIAMSRGLGIPTYLVEVSREPEIDREETLVVVNRHVVAAYRSGAEVLLFDFYLRSNERLIALNVVDDVHASAMYHNNLGAEGLQQGQTPSALRHLEITTILAPDWAPGWVNLGVARVRSEDVEGAYDAYRRALEVDEQNSSALNNLSILYERQGREAEARVALEAAARHGRNPFTLVALADSEMLRGNHRQAKKYLSRARRWYPREAEVFDGLARLADRTGREGREARYRRKAAKLREADASR